MNALLIPLFFLKWCLSVIFTAFVLNVNKKGKLEQTLPRWFLGLKFKAPVIHHSTISWNRQHRFKDTNTFQEIFDEIVLLAMNHKMVGGRVLYTDSTHQALLPAACQNIKKNCNSLRKSVLQYFRLIWHPVD
jgi:Transposase domain (DUF772)